MSQPLNQISQQLTTILAALAGAERIFEVMDAQPEVDEGTVTLTAVRKENGTLTPAGEGERTGCWAWKVPKGGALTLVPVEEGPEGLRELSTPAADSRWAWRYTQNGKTTLPRGRGAVRSVVGEEDYSPERPGAVRQPRPEDRLRRLHRRGQDHRHQPYQPFL